MAALKMEFVLMSVLLTYAESTFGQKVRLEVQFVFHLNCCMC